MVRSREEDEFVLTLSDNDDALHSDPESDGDSQSLKRKRDVPKNGAQSKRRKTQDKKSKAQPLASPPQSETESDDDQGVNDGAIDSDFEFDMGANAVIEDLEEFDGWGEVANTNGNAKKKGVDIDELIARRAAKKHKPQNNGTKVTGDESEEAGEDLPEEEEDIEEDGDEIPDFDDDELVADDTFGAGAASEDEEEGSDSEE